ncbi:MAG: hypothetical protein DMG81_16225 [Acidobacteria bacterium]|nr:MAG: hypothetical protein DMG81_16225 [Acidobacteriota bacterium]
MQLRHDVLTQLRAFPQEAVYRAHATSCSETRLRLRVSFLPAC